MKLTSGMSIPGMLCLLLMRTLLLLFMFQPLFAQQHPADKQATPAVHKLYNQMHALLNKGVLFGHQDDLAYGVGWKYQHGRSDVKDVCGDYPAVYGWDLGRLELGSPDNLDGVPFDSMRSYMRAVYKRGGINTLSWHLHNPGSGGNAWDTYRIVKDILPGGTKYALYTTWLDKLATFLLSIKEVPVIFRPFHEHTGSWFWWGQNNCTTEEYKQLWQFTIQYLQKKQVHNALYAYSPADYNTAEDYLERYPGDDYVDITGTDIYQTTTAADYAKVFRQRMDILEPIATAHHKIPALTETGYERIPAAKWWTETLLPLLESYRLSYVLLWRNGRPDHYYVPYPGQESAADFRDFHASPKTLFQQDLSNPAAYKKTK